MNTSTLENKDEKTNPSESLATHFVSAALDDEATNDENLANLLLQDALSADASDIHIDPQRNHTVIRFRIHGELNSAATIPTLLGQKVINQLKILGKLQPISTAVVGEARFALAADGQQVDVRITAIQCHHGEKLHARLLQNEKQRFTTSDLGMSSQQQETLESWLADPIGMVLVTGPTGAGKTTTLHAIAHRLVASNKNVTTIEDPGRV